MTKIFINVTKKTVRSKTPAFEYIHVSYQGIANT